MLAHNEEALNQTLITNVNVFDGVSETLAMSTSVLVEYETNNDLLMKGAVTHKNTL